LLDFAVVLSSAQTTAFKRLEQLLSSPRVNQPSVMGPSWRSASYNLATTKLIKIE